MQHYFKDIDKNIDALILGCTHFPLLIAPLQNYFGKGTKLIHSGEAIVEHLQKQFDLTRCYKQTDLQFFASENPDRLKKVAQKWLSI